MSKTDYLNLHYHPKSQQEIIAIFYVESKLPLKKIATKIAAESSMVIWTEVNTLTKKIFHNQNDIIYYD